MQNPVKFSSGCRSHVSCNRCVGGCGGSITRAAITDTVDALQTRCLNFFDLVQCSADAANDEKDP